MGMEKALHVAKNMNTKDHAAKLTDEQKTKLKESFTHLDPSGNGSIGVDELRELSESLGTTPENCAKEMKEVDANQDGKVTYEEFEKFYAKKWFKVSLI